MSHARVAFRTQSSTPRAPSPSSRAPVAAPSAKTSASSIVSRLPRFPPLVSPSLPPSLPLCSVRPSVLRPSHSHSCPSIRPSESTPTSEFPFPPPRPSFLVASQKKWRIPRLQRMPRIASRQERASAAGKSQHKFRLVHFLSSS